MRVVRRSDGTTICCHELTTFSHEGDEHCRGCLGIVQLALVAQANEIYLSFDGIVGFPAGPIASTFCINGVPRRRKS